MSLQKSQKSNDNEILDFIRGADNQTLLKGKDEFGTPYLSHIFRLHLKLFGQTCEGCPGKLAGYIQRIKNFNTTKKMENSKNNKGKFQLESGVIIPIRGTSDVISENNITDEKALELLIENPNRKSLFKKLPENLDEMIEKGIPKSEQDENDGKPDAVKIGDYDFTPEKALELFGKAGITTKATTIDGLNKKVKSLKPEELDALKKLWSDELASVEVSSEIETGKDEQNTDSETQE